MPAANHYPVPPGSVAPFVKMSAMTSPLDGVNVTTGAAGSFYNSSEAAFYIAQCSNCAGSQMAVIAFTNSSKWLRCFNCDTPHVATFWANDGSWQLSPSVPPLSTPQGIGPQELLVWQEVRSCLGIGAYTAAVMMCRKLLFHLAVVNGLPAKNDKDRAPTFAQAVQQLENEGVITVRMRPWVDRIKDVGNDANHEITHIGSETAMDVARFTEQLLRLSYEMDALVGGPASSALD